MALEGLVSSDERYKGGSQNYREEGTTSSDPGVSLQELTARPNRHSFLELGEGFPSKISGSSLLISWYLSPIPSALWCSVPDFCN